MGKDSIDSAWINKALSVAERVTTDRIRVQTAERTKRIDRLMVCFFPESREMQEGLSRLEAKLQNGGKFTESDYQDFVRWSDALLSTLETLSIGNKAEHDRKKDDASTQAWVDDFVAELLADDTLSVATHMALAEGISKVSAEITWTDDFRCVQEKTVKVLVPRAILEDAELLDRLHSDLCEADGSLVQEPSSEKYDIESEVTVA
jgi:hypothetical protein